ncbi:hypothetical protein BS78_10G238300 [Paspalum vaginatum]|nr:hypothetical protein BS78_10G238300 [Paspalum vaginatum]
MKIIAWNCRGLGNRPAVRSFLELQKVERADILFLSETKLKERKVKNFRWILGLANCLTQDGDGQGGGIALFWRNGIDVSLRNLSKYHIDVDVKEGRGVSWRFTGVYGESRADQKDKTWRTLTGLISNPVMPWVCGGDFNEVLFSYEKEGGVPRSQRCMDKFRETLEACNLHDLGFCGDSFTWRNNNRREGGYIRERLDRAVANEEWRNLFPGVQIINGDPRHSDHRPVIILTEKERGERNRGNSGPAFHFEAAGG